MENEPVPTIEAREKEIADQMAALQKEAEELAAAKRVLLRLGIAGGQPKTDASNGKPRPRGTPTNFEMAEFVLGSAEKEGHDGLTANELVQAIAARYWPGLIGPQILPSIYQFAKAGRLKLADGKFKKVHKKASGEAN